MVSGLTMNTTGPRPQVTICMLPTVLLDLIIKNIHIVYFFYITAYSYVSFEHDVMYDAGARSGLHARSGQVHSLPLPAIAHRGGSCMVPHVQARHAPRSRFHFSKSLGPGLHAGITQMSGRGLNHVCGCYFITGPVN